MYSIVLKVDEVFGGVEQDLRRVLWDVYGDMAVHSTLHVRVHPARLHVHGLRDDPL